MRKILWLLLFGYLSMTRSFAYIGIPSINLYVGEIALGSLLLFRSRSIFIYWILVLQRQLLGTGLAWAYYCLLGYGMLHLIYGITSQRPIAALQNFALIYYPLFLFVGIWLGLKNRDSFHRFCHILAWIVGIYGAIYILVLNRFQLVIPGTTSIPLFGQPIGAAVAILGLLSFERVNRRIWLPLLLNVFVLLGVQVRAQWLGLIVALFVWAVLTKKIGRLTTAIAATFVIIGALAIMDVNIPAPQGRGGVISVQEILGRMVAPINRDWASQLTDRASIYAGTVSWRTQWWGEIWINTNASPDTLLLGHGIGYSLTDFVPYLEGHNDVRTPHNVFFFVLGYMGWIGVIFFSIFQLNIVRLLFLSFNNTGQPFGVSYWVMGFIIASLGNFWETPFGAIPFYTLIGISLSPLFELSRDTQMGKERNRFNHAYDHLSKV